MNKGNFLLLLSALLICFAPAAVSGQTNNDGSMPQYLFPGFTEGRVLMKNGQVQTELMNFNIVTGRIVYYKNDKYWDLSNSEMTDTIYIKDRKFTSFGKSIYEVLLIDDISLFIQHKGSLLSAGSTVGYGGKSQVAATSTITSVDLSSGRFNLPISADFIVNPSPVYWIRMDNEMKDFLNEKQFLNLFPGKSVEIRDFIKKNRLKIDKPEQLVRIVSFCNGL
jgi:hypothetical protein